MNQFSRKIGNGKLTYWSGWDKIKVTRADDSEIWTNQFKTAFKLLGLKNKNKQLELF